MAVLLESEAVSPCSPSFEELVDESLEEEEVEDFELSSLELELSKDWLETEDLESEDPEDLLELELLSVHPSFQMQNLHAIGKST